MIISLIIAVSDPIKVQIISSLGTVFVTLVALWFHRRQGSKENTKIQTSINGDRQIMIDKIDELQKEVARLVKVNDKLEAEKK